MHVFYEDEGALKAATVLTDQNTSLHIETPHGKRAKIKSAAVLLRFETPGTLEFLSEAQRLADEIDVNFLWECCGDGEFAYEDLAREYFGATPSASQRAAIALKVHGAPMYFYKKGRGRYKAAPGEALKAALASVERKKQQALQKDRYVADLTAERLPESFRPVLRSLLYRPDKASLEWKALEEASAALKLTPLAVLERAGALASPHDYHFERFLFEHFPRGTDTPGVARLETPEDFPRAEVSAFSIDDALTTEIDDAFSVSTLDNGNIRIGIHIAAPALGIVRGGPVDATARERLSTVYYPGGKITMLPEAAIARYTLSEGCDCPALSLYTELTPDFELVSSATCVERVPVADNLRHDALEHLLTREALAAGVVAHVRAREFQYLWRWASLLEQARRGDVPEPEQRAEFVFRVEGERVTITRRARGSPLDKIVSELMIYVNSEWGRQLSEHDLPAIYRVQNAGKVRMSTIPAGHQALGVAQYAWASSPLRRYVDLLNQRQLIALTRGEPPPYAAGDENVLEVMRDFEATYEAYADFQRTMERYWSLRWLQQEALGAVAGAVLRDNLVRLEDVPVVVRVPALPVLPAGARVMLSVERIDLLELALHCGYHGALELETSTA